jgi:hypothetical protein
VFQRQRLTPQQLVLGRQLSGRGADAHFELDWRRASTPQTAALARTASVKSCRTVTTAASSDRPARTLPATASIGIGRSVCGSVSVIRSRDEVSGSAHQQPTNDENRAQLACARRSASVVVARREEQLRGRSSSGSCRGVADDDWIDDRVDDCSIRRRSARACASAARSRL